MAHFTLYRLNSKAQYLVCKRDADDKGVFSNVLVVAHQVKILLASYLSVSVYLSCSLSDVAPC